MSPEYSVLRNYLDWLCELPWSVSTRDKNNLNVARRILNADHYDMSKVKKRVLEFLAVKKLNPTGRSPILCFVGPPGVGKTSLGRSIARCMGRKFIRISLGGIRDEADIRGHRRTYVGALPGRIVQELRKAGSNNPVFMLDELDKVGQDFRGDPASALLEVLDPQQNNTFTDHYLDQPFDLSKVMFIGTANCMDTVPAALRDRLEVLALPGYTAEEKLFIAKRHLLPRQLSETGLTEKTLKIKDTALDRLITSYTREAGVRELERQIAAICRGVAADIASGKCKSTVVSTDKHLIAKLGPFQYESELALHSSLPGVATGLAYTPTGGEILFVEATRMPGKGQLILTGQLGRVMKESAKTALSVLKSAVLGNGKKIGASGVMKSLAEALADHESFIRQDIHIHVPAGAIPKDGPSAGLAMYTSLASLLTGLPVRSDIAMTGEITLRGIVLPIGGVKEKLLAAKRAGIQTVILPERNRKDLVDLPRDVLSQLKFEFVRNVDKVLQISLEDGQ
jgi:ATP-dependent Lon protease